MKRQKLGWLGPGCFPPACRRPSRAWRWAWLKPRRRAEQANLGRILSFATVPQRLEYQTQREWLLKHHGVDHYVHAMREWGARRGRACGWPSTAIAR